MLPGAVIGALHGPCVSGRLVRPLRRADAWSVPGVLVAVLGASGLARLGIDSELHQRWRITYTDAGGRLAVHHDAAEHLGRELAGQPRDPARAGGVQHPEPGGGLRWARPCWCRCRPWRPMVAPEASGRRAGVPGRAHGLLHHVRRSCAWRGWSSSALRARQDASSAERRLRELRRPRRHERLAWSRRTTRPAYRRRGRGCFDGRAFAGSVRRWVCGRWWIPRGLPRARGDEPRAGVRGRPTATMAEVITPDGRATRRAGCPWWMPQWRRWWASCPTATWRAYLGADRARSRATRTLRNRLPLHRRRDGHVGAPQGRCHGAERHGRGHHAASMSVRGDNAGGRGCAPCWPPAPHQEGARGARRPARRRPVPPQHHALPRRGHRPAGEVGAPAITSPTISRLNGHLIGPSPTMGDGPSWSYFTNEPRVFHQLRTFRPRAPSR